MADTLLSVGLDVGTTSTQLVVSRLTVCNRASSFAVPELEIGQRQILYQSPVYFTPLLTENRMDAPALRALVEQEYRAAGIRREDVDTGAVIVTGETSRRENAAAVMAALSDLAGDFVVAAAGPDLESALAAKGAGAVAHSRKTGETVLHMDIGGGTCNLALIRAGEIAATGCLNVGGRLIKLKKDGEITYISPVLDGIFPGKVGQRLTQAQAEALAACLARVMEMGAGLRPPDGLLQNLITQEARGVLPLQQPGAPVTISFSGGVADCILRQVSWLEYGDIGPLLGSAIRRSRLCAGKYLLGEQTIRATVIGAGCHSAQLSGSTVFCRNVQLPLKNIPVITGESEQAAQEEPVFLALSGPVSANYGEVMALADRLARVLKPPVYLCVKQDMAQALGQMLALRLDRDVPILCIDRIHAEQGSFLDVGAPVGPAFPVVVKTLILQSKGEET